MAAAAAAAAAILMQNNIIRQLVTYTVRLCGLGPTTQRQRLLAVVLWTGSAVLAPVMLSWKCSLTSDRQPETDYRLRLHSLSLCSLCDVSLIATRCFKVTVASCQCRI